MEILYKNRDIKKICTDIATAENRYGKRVAKKIFQRINEIIISEELDEVKNDFFNGFQELPSRSKKLYSVNLSKLHLLIFTNENNIIKFQKIEGVS